MARDRILTGIDIGTSKISTLISSVSDEDEVRVIGVATVTSRGLRKGQVVNIDEASSSISQSLELAERMAGTSVSHAFLSIGGSHIASINSHGVAAVAEPDREITASDVKRVIEAAKAVQLPSSREIIHILPRGYIVDGQEGIVDPVGMTGVRLEVDTHLVTGGSTAVKNLTKCVEELGVHVDGLVFSGLASAYASVSETERELGVVLVDIGGGTTDVAIFVEGALSYSSVIPIGAINITKDIAAGLRMSLESAEKLKMFIGKTSKEPTQPVDRPKTDKSADEIDITSLHLVEDVKTISRKTLIEGIIKPRLNEIFTLVGHEIKRSTFGGLTPSGIVLTGGGATTVGAIESARRNLAMPVHIGMPSKVSGLIDEIMTPEFTVPVGLVLFGVSSDVYETGTFLNSFSKIGDKVQVRGLAGKVVDLIKSLLP